MLLALLLAFLGGPSIGAASFSEVEGPTIETRQDQEPPDPVGPANFVCDMTSATCSDSRRITTNRSSTVPCEKQASAWTQVGINEGCYNQKGELEVWAGTTNNLSSGDDLLGGRWTDRNQLTTIVERTESGQRLSVKEGYNGVKSQTVGRFQPGMTATSACIARASEDSEGFLETTFSGYASPAVCPFEPGGEFKVHSCSLTLEGDADLNGWIRIHPETKGWVEIVGCWLVVGSIPRRPCWGGSGDNFRCEPDEHTLSTAAFPTTEGSVSITWRMERTEGAFQTLLNSRIGSTGNDQFVLEINIVGGLAVRGWGNQQQTGARTWENGTSYTALVEWGPWGRRVRLNGETVIESAEPTSMGWGPTMTIGSDNRGLQQINGAIAELIVKAE